MLRFVALALFGAAICNAALIGGGALGGYKDADKNDDDVKDVVSFAEARLNAMSNDMYSSRVSNVIKVQRQLVNGINYKIEFEFEGTSCSKMSLITLESCPTSGKVAKCVVKVYQSFSGEKSLNDFNCTPVKTVQRRAGSISDPVPNPEAFRSEALRAISSANSDLDATNFKVVEVRLQTVAGRNLYMKLEGMVKGVLTRCDMTVWVRAWLEGDEGFQVTSDKCYPVKERRNVIGGGCPGCVSDETAVTEEVKGYLFQALDSDDSNFHLDTTKTKFVSMTTQVVAGMKYTINLQTEVDGKMTKCQIVIVNAPWMTPVNRITENTCM